MSYQSPPQGPHTLHLKLSFPEGCGHYLTPTVILVDDTICGARYSLHVSRKFLSTFLSGNPISGTVNFFTVFVSAASPLLLSLLASKLYYVYRAIHPKCRVHMFFLPRLSSWYVTDYLCGEGCVRQVIYLLRCDWRQNSGIGLFGLVFCSQCPLPTIL